MSDKKTVSAPNQAQENNPADDGAKDSNDKSRAAELEPEPSSSKPDLLPPANQQNKSGDESCKCKEEKIDWFERGGIIAGVIGVIFLIFQYREMIKATNATLDAVKASQGQLEEMKNSRILDERAWVVCNDVIVETNQDFVTFKVEFKNSGKTPAIKTEIRNVTAGNLDESKWYDSKPTNRTNSGLMAPGGVAYSIFSVSNDIILKTNNTFYIYGTVWYDDIFKFHHWSQYYWLVNYTAAPNGYLTVRAGAVHNSCDDEEKAQSN